MGLSNGSDADDRLKFPERLLLWALRAWVVGMRRRLDTVEPLRSAFAQAGAEDAAELVDALMSIVACGATRPLTVECVCHQGLSEDEHRLLVAATLHQAGRGLEARFLLREMLAPAASRDAGEILDRLGAALAAAGLQLSRWPAGTQRFAYGPQPEPSRPTLH